MSMKINGALPEPAELKEEYPLPPSNGGETAEVDGQME